MNQALSLLVYIEVQDGKAQEQIDAFRQLAPLVLAEDGCLQYELKQVEGSSNNFILIERWLSEKALASHDNTPHMIEADTNNKNFRAKPAKLVRLINV
jgi:quinol monooxygenase YgiN